MFDDLQLSHATTRTYSKSGMKIYILVLKAPGQVFDFHSTGMFPRLIRTWEVERRRDQASNRSNSRAIPSDRAIRRTIGTVLGRATEQSEER